MPVGLISGIPSIYDRLPGLQGLTLEFDRQNLFLSFGQRGI
jgi:hypothetical protein